MFFDEKHEKKFTLTQKNDVGFKKDLYKNLLIEGEQVLMEFMSSRYVLAVTERKLIAIRIEAFTGRHKAALILPYSKMTAFSVELAEEDEDQIEFCIWTPSIDTITFYFNNGIIDIKAFLSIIAKHIQ